MSDEALGRSLALAMQADSSSSDMVRTALIGVASLDRDLVSGFLGTLSWSGQPLERILPRNVSIPAIAGALRAPQTDPGASARILAHLVPNLGITELETLVTSVRTNSLAEQSPAAHTRSLSRLGLFIDTLGELDLPAARTREATQLSESLSHERATIVNTLDASPHGSGRDSSSHGLV